MPATVLWRKKGDQLLSAGGVPLNGGKLHFYEAGTTTPQNTYSDAAGTVPNANPVELGSDGRLQTAVYLGDTSSHANYKELLTTSADVTVSPWPFDDIPASPPEASSDIFASPLFPWEQTAAATVNLTAADAGSAYEANTTGNNITFNLPSAASVGNGKGFAFKKTAAANSMIIDPAGSETIDDASTALTITAKDALIGIVSNGAEWYTVYGYGLLRIINALTEDTTPDTEADFIGSYDASALVEKKVRFKNIPGRIIQRAYVQSTAFSTTTVMPADGSIPQITEGGELLTAAITPKSATNRIRVRAFATLETNINATAHVGLALFNGGASALAVASASQGDNGVQMPLSLLYENDAGGVSAITYSVRAGAGAAGTCMLGTLHGAPVLAGMIIEEIVP